MFSSRYCLGVVANLASRGQRWGGEGKGGRTSQQPSTSKSEVCPPSPLILNSMHRLQLRCPTTTFRGIGGLARQQEGGMNHLTGVVTHAARP